MTKKRVTVLGSSGQIGAYLTEYLRKKGYFVRYAPICPLEPNIATLIKLKNKFVY